MSVDTYSSSLGYLQMGTGNDNNTWGTNCNASVFQVFEDAITNSLTSTVTGGTLDLSANAPPLGPSQARYGALIFNGTLTSTQTVKVPNIFKFWMVKNATAGAFTLTFQTPNGSPSAAIPQNGGWQMVMCDGVNDVIVSPFNWATGGVTLPITGQCRLSYQSASSLLLAPKGGNIITIAGTQFSLPAGGFTTSPASTFVGGVPGGLSVSSVYDAYVFNNAGNPALDFYANATHVTDTTPGNIGIEILSGNNSRSYVGKIATDSNANFQPQGTGVISWFNPLPWVLNNNVALQNTKFSSKSFTEVSSSLRLNFLTFGDRMVQGMANAFLIPNQNAASEIFLQEMLDNAATGSDPNVGSNGGCNIVGSAGTGSFVLWLIGRSFWQGIPTEGQHLFTPAISSGDSNQVAVDGGIDHHCYLSA